MCCYLISETIFCYPHEFSVERIGSNYEELDELFVVKILQYVVLH